MKHSHAYPRVRVPTAPSALMDGVVVDWPLSSSPASNDPRYCTNTLGSAAATNDPVLLAIGFPSPCDHFATVSNVPTAPLRLFRSAMLSSVCWLGLTVRFRPCVALHTLHPHATHASVIFCNTCATGCEQRGVLPVYTGHGLYIQVRRATVEALICIDRHDPCYCSRHANILARAVHMLIYVDWHDNC